MKIESFTRIRFSGGVAGLINSGGVATNWKFHGIAVWRTSFILEESLPGVMKAVEAETTAEAEIAMAEVGHPFRRFSQTALKISR
jgi:hypothetical protein